MRADPSLERHLRSLEERLLQPEVRRSADEVAAVLADDFVEFGSSGRVFDKRQIIEALQGETPVRRSLADFKVVLLAEDVALATYRALRPGDPGSERGLSLRSSVWTLRDGRWQMIFHQGTLGKEATPLARGETSAPPPRAAARRDSISRRLLQVAVSFSAAQAIIGGGLYLWFGVAGLSLVTRFPLPIATAEPTWAVVDYMYRALADIWFGLGLMLAYIVPSIEKHSAWFALICVALWCMGVGRFLSLMEFASVAANSRAAMVAELVLPPILVFWQRRVTRSA